MEIHKVLVQFSVPTPVHATTLGSPRTALLGARCRKSLQGPSPPGRRTRSVRPLRSDAGAVLRSSSIEGLVHDDPL